VVVSDNVYLQETRTQILFPRIYDRDDYLEKHLYKEK